MKKITKVICEALEYPSNWERLGILVFSRPFLFLFFFLFLGRPCPFTVVVLLLVLLLLPPLLLSFVFTSRSFSSSMFLLFVFFLLLGGHLVQQRPVLLRQRSRVEPADIISLPILLSQQLINSPEPTWTLPAAAGWEASAPSRPLEVSLSAAWGWSYPGRRWCRWCRAVLAGSWRDCPSSSLLEEKRRQ